MRRTLRLLRADAEGRVLAFLLRMLGDRPWLIRSAARWYGSHYLALAKD